MNRCSNTPRFREEIDVKDTPMIDDMLQGRVEPGDKVTVEGWVRTRRDSRGGFSFLEVHDGSCFDTLQFVIGGDLENYEEEVLNLTAGCAVRITGTLVESRGAGQAVEVQADEVEVLGWVEDPDTYPMAPKEHTMVHLRKHAHLRPRTNLIGAATRVRHALASAIHRYFDDNGFFWIHTPIITTSDAEGAGELFRVSTLDLMNLPHTEDGTVDFSQDFFGQEAFLTVSGQLNVEAYCLAMSKVYTFGPTFRAENSNTSRHLAEFWMVEPEIAFADLDDDAELAEDFLKYVFKELLDRSTRDMEFFDDKISPGCIENLEKFIESDFAQMEYGEAVEILESVQEEEGFEFPVSWGVDLQSEHERYLAEKHVGRPVVVRNYPKDIKAFYMRLNDDGKTVAAMDVLAPGMGEIIGGAQREERLDVLDERIEALGHDPQEYDWYRDLRRYGSVPHAGFGLGFERTIAYATGIENVRDVIPFPRTPRNARF